MIIKIYFIFHLLRYHSQHNSISGLEYIKPIMQSVLLIKIIPHLILSNDIIFNMKINLHLMLIILHQNHAPK